jgi:hypothetical protein
MAQSRRSGQPFHGTLVMTARCVHDIHVFPLTAAVAHIGKRHEKRLEHPENEQNGVPQNTQNLVEHRVNKHGTLLLRVKLVGQVFKLPKVLWLCVVCIFLCCWRDTEVSNMLLLLAQHGLRNCCFDIHLRKTSESTMTQWRIQSFVEKTL